VCGRASGRPRRARKKRVGAAVPSGRKVTVASLRRRQLLRPSRRNRRVVVAATAPLIPMWQRRLPRSQGMKSVLKVQAGASGGDAAAAAAVVVGAAHEVMVNADRVGRMTKTIEENRCR